MQPDERNIGGKKQIFDEMFNHQLNLINMKPQVKSQIKNLEKISVAKKAPKKNFHQFDEVLESFKRASCVKGSNLSKQPETFELKHMLAKKKNKVNNYVDYQHELNLRSQKRRINSLGTMNERKKNNFDPIAKPVYFLRKPNTSHKDISLQTFCEKLGVNPTEKENKRPFNLTQKDYTIKENTANNRNLRREMNRKPDYQEIKKKGNLRYNKIDSKGFTKKKQETNGFYCAPTTKGDTEENYVDLKSKLLHIIVDNRIYQEETLKDLLERTIILNPHMNPQKVEEVFNFLIEELEK